MGTPAQDWFAANAPKPAQTGDWFKDNAPQAPAPQQGHADSAGSTGAVFKASPERFSKAWWKEQMYNAIDATLESLPAAGATMGGVVGGTGGAAAGSVVPGAGTVGGGVAGAVGGAGIGGMAGEAARQIGRRAMGWESPETSTDAANKIAGEGALQGGVEAATAGLGNAMRMPMKELARTQYYRALSPATKPNKAITKTIVPEALDRQVRGGLDAIVDRSEAEAGALTKPLNKAYDAIQPNVLLQKMPVSETMSALDRFKERFVVGGKVANPEAVRAIENVQGVVSQWGNDISPQELRRVKQIFDESVAAAGGYTGTDLSVKYKANAERLAANRIRSLLHEVSPEAKNIDANVKFWLDLKRVASATAERRVGQEGGLVKTLWPIGAAVAGAAAGGGGGYHAAGGEGAATGAAATSALAAMVTIAVRSPQWRTSSAVFKNEFAEALLRGSPQKVSALLLRLGVAVPGSRIKEQSGDLQTQPERQ